MKFDEVTKYHTIFDASASCGGRMLMNWNTYNGLPPDIRKVIDESLDEYQRSYFEPIEQNNRSVYEGLKGKKDHEVINLPPEELSRFYKLLDDEGRTWAASLDAKGLPGTKIFEFIRQEIEKSQ